MHYIRFLKPPRLMTGKASTLVSKITITTDLGESFLFTDIPFVAELEFEGGSKIGSAVEYLWNGRDGMRSLEIKVPFPASVGRTGKKVKLLVRPKDDVRAVNTFLKALGEQNEPDLDAQGGVVAVRSMSIDTNAKGQNNVSASMAERVFTSGKKEIHIWEETGESIARHIWYG